MSQTESIAELTALVRGMEHHHKAINVSFKGLMSVLSMQNEMLVKILDAATHEPGPSPVAEKLSEIIVAMDRQSEALAELPRAMAAIILEEMAE